MKDQNNNEPLDARSRKDAAALGEGQMRNGSSADASRGSETVSDLLTGWDRRDFVSALPLFVGGDLDRGETARVEAWLEAHPEDRESLAATEAAAGVLRAHAGEAHLRETPDLWVGIRSELVQSGLIQSAAVAAEFQGGSGADSLAPILGGPDSFQPRWYERKSVAAAAALLLIGSMGTSMMLRAGGTGGAGDLSASATRQIAESASETADPTAALAAGSLAGADLPSAIVGSQSLPMGVEAVGGAENRTRVIPVRVTRAPSRSKVASQGVSQGASQASTGGQRLQRPAPGAERLIDDAPNVILWQVEPMTLDPQLGGARLTGGR